MGKRKAKVGNSAATPAPPTQQGSQEEPDESSSASATSTSGLPSPPTKEEDAKATEMLLIHKIKELQIKKNSTAGIRQLEKIVNAKDEGVVVNETEACRDLDGIYSDERMDTDERIEAMRALYGDLVADMQRLEMEISSLKKSCTDSLHSEKVLKKEIELSEVDLKRKKLKKSTLEEECRLARLKHKIILEDNARVKEEEQKKREGLEAQASVVMDDVTLKIKEQEEEREANGKENEELAGKLKLFVEKTNSQQEYMEATLKAKGLEVELLQARIAQQEQVLAQEVLASKHYAGNVSSLEKGNKALEEQIRMYRQKFEQFEEALKTENVLGTFAEKLEMYTKHVETLEKEKQELKGLAETFENKTVSARDQHTGLKQQLEEELSEKAKLEKYCRGIQTERVKKLQKITDLKETLAYLQDKTDMIPLVTSTNPKNPNGLSGDKGDYDDALKIEVKTADNENCMVEG